MTEWFRDGRPCTLISADDRGLQYGDGLFETVAVRDGAPRLWDYHVERLRNGAARLGLPPRGRGRAAIDVPAARLRPC